MARGSEGPREPWPQFALKFRETDLTLRLGGRLMVDATFGQGSDLQLRDPVEVRRGRAFFSFKLKKQWRGRISYEFAGFQPAFKDAWLDYRTSGKKFGLRIGQFQEPFGLENLTSSKHITFMERALPTALIPGYSLGFGASARGKYWNASGGAFGGSINDRSLDISATGWGVSARFTVSPIHRHRRVLHFGVSGLYREPDSSNRLRFRARPEMRLVDAPRIDSRSISGVTSWRSLGFEAAAVWGSFSVQGEYVRSDVARIVGRANFVADGWYAFVSWFPTGESRRFSRRTGTLLRLKPLRKWGALEIAARVSELDFDSSGRPAGAGRSVTVGLNWYVTSQVRLMANYVHANVDNRDTSSDVDLFGLRFQLDF